jgi:hypothetical protein
MQGAETQTFRRLSIGHSAEISENMKKISKSSTIQIGLVTQKVSQSILRDSEVYKSKDKGNKRKWPQKSSRNQK